MMEKAKATCLYCGMIGEMDVKARYVVDKENTHLEEIECPRCRRLFCRRERKEERHDGRKGNWIDCRDALPEEHNGHSNGMKSVDINIIDGKICLNGRAAPGSEGFKVKAKGIRKSKAGIWVCTKCGAKGAKKIFYQESQDGGWMYRFKCECGNIIEIEKRRTKE